MFTLILAGFALIMLALFSDAYNDACVQACFHRQQPAEDGCVHEVEPQPTYALIDEDQHGFGMEHWDNSPFSEQELTNAARSVERNRIKSMLSGIALDDDAPRDYATGQYGHKLWTMDMNPSPEFVAAVGGPEQLVKRCCLCGEADGTGSEPCNGLPF